MSRPRRRGRRRPGAAVRWLVVLAAFVLGVALGAALDDNSGPATTTYERTLRVVTLTGGR